MLHTEEVLKGLHESIEKMMTNVLKQQGKRTHLDQIGDDSVHNRASGSGHKTTGGRVEGFYRDDRDDGSNFSQPKGRAILPGEGDDHIDEVKTISALIPNQSEEQAVGMFVRGLKEEIPNWLRALNPSTCDPTTEYPCNVKLATMMQGSKSHYKGRSSGDSGAGLGGDDPNLSKLSPTNNNPSNNRSMTTTDSATPLKPIPSYSSPRFHHLHKEEQENQRQNGDDGEIYTLKATLEEEKIEDGKSYMLESFGFLGKTIHDVNTLKLKEELGGNPIPIIVDNSCTHNFLYKRLAIALGLEIKPIKRWIINFGGGTREGNSEHCQRMAVRIGSYSCVIDALIYELEFLDMILGNAWLSKLGDVLFNQHTRRICSTNQGTRGQL